MAGKGRGVAAFTFSIEALGITRGSMPETQRGPRPLFPPTEFKPVPLKVSEDEDYMLALKQEFRGKMKGLPFNLKPAVEKPDVERYKEKYVREMRKAEDEEWTPEWNRLPKELKPQTRQIRKKTDSKKVKKVTSKDKEVMISKLDALEKRGDEKSDEEKEDKEKKGNEEEDEGEAEEEEIEEEEFEEENDYIASYFDGGDDYGAGSDDNMDEATY